MTNSNHSQFNREPLTPNEAGYYQLDELYNHSDDEGCIRFDARISAAALESMGKVYFDVCMRIPVEENRQEIQLEDPTLQFLKSEDGYLFFSVKAKLPARITLEFDLNNQ